MGVGRASVGNAGVSREAISHKPLAISPERGELVISVGKQRGEEVVIVGDWFVEGLRTRLAVAAEHEVAEMREEAGFGRREEAIGDGDGEFGEDTTDFVGGDHGAARSDEFAGEIGGAKAAVRGVGMGVAEAVTLRMSGQGAAASIGEGESAARELGGRAQREKGGTREEPFGRLRADILRRMSERSWEDSARFVVMRGE